MTASWPDSAALATPAAANARVTRVESDPTAGMLRAEVLLDGVPHRVFARWKHGDIRWDCSCGDNQCGSLPPALDAARGEGPKPTEAATAPLPIAPAATTEARVFYQLTAAPDGLTVALHVGLAPSPDLPVLALRRALASPPPRFVQEDDRAIIEQLAPDGGVQDPELLEAIVRTGRAHLAGPAAEPLSWGGSRAAERTWQMAPDGAQRIAVNVDAAMLTLIEDPPVLLDSEHLVWVPDLAMDLESWLALREPIAIDAVGEAWNRLRISLEADVLDTLPAPFVPTSIVAEAVAPEPRFELGRTSTHGTGRLRFRYGTVDIDPATALDPIVSTRGETAVRLARDWVAEAAALGRLRRSRWQGGPVEWTLPGGAATLARFLIEEEPALTDAGWTLVRSDTCPRVELLESGDLRIDLTRNDARLVDTSEQANLLGLGAAPVACGERLLIETMGGRVIGVDRELFRDVQLALGGQQAATPARLATLPIATQGATGRATPVLGALPPAEDARIPSDLEQVLRPYQAAGVAWLQQLDQAGFGGILADDMGLGKTLQTLTFLREIYARTPDASPSLIVAPLSLLDNWRSEAERFAPELAVTVHHGPQRDVAVWADATLVLTTYGLLRTEQAQFEEASWRVIALDEAQAIKNPRSRTARAVRSLNAPMRICLSGTPMENHLGELWSLFAFAQPGLLGALPGFEQTFRKPIEEGDDERRGALARRIRPFMLRRTRGQVLGELPPLIESERRIELGEEQRALYESLRSSALADLEALDDADDFTRRARVLQIITRLRQACCAPTLLPDGFPLRDAPSAKLDVLDEMLDELIAEGRTVLVFSQFTGLLDAVRERLAAREVDTLMLTGQSRDRATLIREFQAGAVPVFLISLKAGGAGLNLTKADTVILLDPWWNPAVEQQAAARAHRMGQNRSVFLYRLIAADTVEEDMQDLKQGKRRLNDALAEAVERLELTDSSFLDDLAGEGSSQ